MVLTYSKLLPIIRDIVRKHSKVLYRSDKMEEVFSKLPMRAYRRDTAKLVYSSERRCECKVCQALHEDEVCDVTGQQMYKPVQQPAWSLQNVVNALLCRQCGKTIYVGETGRWKRESVSTFGTWKIRHRNRSWDILKDIGWNMSSLQFYKVSVVKGKPTDNWLKKDGLWD